VEGVGKRWVHGTQVAGGVGGGGGVGGRASGGFRSVQEDLIGREKLLLKDGLHAQHTVVYTFRKFSVLPFHRYIKTSQQPRQRERSDCIQWRRLLV
jgi:hypothetical protein